MIQSNKNVLRMAVLATLTVGSFAANAALVDVVGAAFSPAQVANEMPITGIVLTANANQLRAGSAITSFAPSTGQNLLMSVTLNNGATFKTAPVAACIDATAGNSAAGTLNLGGAGSNQAVFTVDFNAVSAAITAGATLTRCYVSAADLNVTGAHADVNMSISYTYGTLASSVASGTLVQFQNSLADSVVAGTDKVANVVSGFVTLSGAVTLLTAGTISWVTDATAASTATNLATLMVLGDALGVGSGSITVAGTSLVASKVTGGVWLETNGCTNAGAGLATAAGGVTPVTFTGLTAANLSAGTTNVCVSFDGVTAIPAGSITAQVGGTAKTGYSLPATTALTLMSITRNGTTLVAPLVNVPAGWISRLVLVNRGSSAANYAVTATGETGNTVTLTGAAASGSIAAGTTSVVDLSGLVTTTGSARTSLSVTVDGVSSNIDGLYQIVNSAAGSISNYALVSK